VGVDVTVVAWWWSTLLGGAADWVVDVGVATVAATVVKDTDLDSANVGVVVCIVECRLDGADACTVDTACWCCCFCFCACQLARGS
jgi:hypothetical protein